MSDPAQTVSDALMDVIHACASQHFFVTKPVEDWPAYIDYGVLSVAVEQQGAVLDNFLALLDQPLGLAQEFSIDEG